MTVDNTIMMELDSEVKEMGKKLTHCVDKIDKVYRLLVGEEDARQNAVLSRLEKAESKLEQHAKIHTMLAASAAIILFIPTIYGIIMVITKLLELFKHTP